MYLSRSVVLELLQALKLKSPLPDTNLLLLVQVGFCLVCDTFVRSTDIWKISWGVCMNQIFQYHICQAIWWVLSIFPLLNPYNM